MTHTVERGHDILTVTTDNNSITINRNFVHSVRDGGFQGAGVRGGQMSGYARPQMPGPGGRLPAAEGGVPLTARPGRQWRY